MDSAQQFDPARAETDLDYLLDCKLGDLGDRVQEESKSFNTMRLVQWWMRHFNNPKGDVINEEGLLRAWANNIDYEQVAAAHLQEFLDRNSGFYYQIRYNEYTPESEEITVYLVWKNRGVVVFEHEETFTFYRKEYKVKGVKYYYYHSENPRDFWDDE